MHNFERSHWQLNGRVLRGASGGREASKEAGKSSGKRGSALAGEVVRSA